MRSGVGRGGVGRDGSKKFKSIPVPPHRAGLKSCSIPAPSPLRGKKNSHGTKRGGAGQTGRGKIAILSSTLDLFFPKCLTRSLSISSSLSLLSLSHSLSPWLKTQIDSDWVD